MNEEAFFTEEDLGEVIIVDDEKAIIGRDGYGSLAVLRSDTPNRISRTYAGCIKNGNMRKIGNMIITMKEYPIIFLGDGSGFRRYRTNGCRVYFYPDCSTSSEPDTFERLSTQLRNVDLL